MDFNFIIPPAITAIVFYGIFKIIQLFVCRKERLILVENIARLAECKSEGQPIINLPMINYGSTPIKFNALRWGCLLFGCGLGILVGYIMCIYTIPDYFNADKWWLSTYTSVIYSCCLFIFGGASLIISFIIEYKLGFKKDNEESSQH